MDNLSETQESEQPTPEKLLTDLLNRLKEECQEAQNNRFSQWNVLLSMPRALDPPEPSAASPMRNFNAHSPWNDRQDSPYTRSLRKERAILIHRLQSTRPWAFQDPSSFDDFPIQVQFAIDHALELGIAALELPTVHKVLSDLEAVVINDTFDMSLRKKARNLLQALFKAMLPQLRLKEASITGELQRFKMLKCYEEAHCKIIEMKRIRNHDLRFKKLCDTFQDVPKDRLKHWFEFGNKPEKVAQEITAYRFGPTAETIRKLLQEARRRRNDLRAREDFEEKQRRIFQEEPEDDEELAHQAYEENQELMQAIREDPVERLLMDYGLSPWCHLWEDGADESNAE